MVVRRAVRMARMVAQPAVAAEYMVVPLADKMLQVVFALFPEAAVGVDILVSLP